MFDIHQVIRRSRFSEEIVKGESNPSFGTISTSTPILAKSSDRDRSSLALKKQENLLKKTRVKTISRHNFYNSLFDNESKDIDMLSRARNTKKGVSFSKTGLPTYRITNDRFFKPILTQRKADGHALRKAVSEVKPCIDLRQVRRGRKTFQIPRIIPSAKRQLFGVRRLLSILSASVKKGVETSMKGKVFEKRRGSVDGNRSGALASLKNLGNESLGNALPLLAQPKVFDKHGLSVAKHNKVLHHPVSQKPGLNLATTEIPLFDPSNKEKALGHKTNLSTSTRHHTRTTQEKESKLSSLSLSYALGNEIKASSRSRSRAIENKKRIYRVASANRGSIRMSWWL